MNIENDDANDREKSKQQMYKEVKENEKIHSIFSVCIVYTYMYNLQNFHHSFEVVWLNATQE